MNNLDQCLTQLADVLRTMGVEELMISEHSQHHIINHETKADESIVEGFCNYIRQLYDKMPHAKH